MTRDEISARVGQSWLVDAGQARRFHDLFGVQGVASDGIPGCPMVDLVDRVDFLARFLSLVQENTSLALGNPYWGKDEWRQARALVSPGLTDESGCRIFIPTGGTGGRVKFAIHTWETLHAAVGGYSQFWNSGRLNAICPLPVCHIGGLMLALRTFITGGKLWLADSKLEEPPPREFDLSTAHLSLVGAQLRRALDNGVAWLRECEAVLVGGGPTDEGLIDEALTAGIPLYTAYGMTEAGATIALAKAGEELALGEVLPHWKVSISGGEICLDGPALFQGYLREAPRSAGPWKTGDRGALVGGKLRVLGRERMIITGGKKVDASLLEERLNAWEEMAEALVYAESHPKWGQAVCAVVVTSLPEAQLDALARERLMPEMRPKQWKIVRRIPRLDNGKPNWPLICGVS